MLIESIGESMEMKHSFIAVFGIIFLCGLINLAAIATAYNAAFTHTLYQTDSPPTIDGTYTTAEWAASGPQRFGTTGVFRDMWTMSPNLACLLIETADTTNDAGDYWVICYDSTAAGGATEPNGGPAPQTDDYKLVITGHDASATVQWFKGTGTAWSTTPATGVSAGLLTQKQSLSATPAWVTPHYVLELYIDKSDTSLGTVPMGYTWAQFVGYYDAHAGGAGLQQWPPTPASVNVPNGWGYITYESNAAPSPSFPTIPEGLTIGTVVLMSFVALVVSYYFLRKPPRTVSQSTGKIGKAGYTY